MKHAIIFILFSDVTWFVCLVWCQSATNVGNESGPNCSPINCQALCSPGCSTDTTCVLGTMKLCGVCPSSLCISNSFFGLPVAPGDNGGSGNGDDGTATAANPGDDRGIFGGMIGGLVGGGLLLVTAGLVLMLWHKKQNIKTFSGHLPPLSQKDHTTSAFSISNTGLSTSPMSISTSILPTSRASQEQNKQPQGHTMQTSLRQKQQTPPTNRQPNDNPDVNDDDDDDDGGSSVSSVSHHGLASMITFGGQNQQQGFPGTRLKPQIMRLSTVRSSMVNTSLNRNGTSSVRTTLTPTTMSLPGSAKSLTTISNINNNSTSSTVSPLFSTMEPTASVSVPSLETETCTNPFDDRHCVIYG